jgi:hypothetical protein
MRWVDTHGQDARATTLRESSAPENKIFTNSSTDEHGLPRGNVGFSAPWARHLCSSFITNMKAPAGAAYSDVAPAELGN